MAKAKSPAFVPTDTPHAAPTGTAYVPDLGPVTREQPATQVDACPPFLLKAHRERWTVMGGKVIPLFGRIVLQAGVGGVSSRPGGKIDAADARNMAESAGWTIIPTTAIPDHHASAGGVKSYLYRPESRDDVTLLIYTKCYPGSKILECDAPRYVEFCEHLQDSGVIDRPPAYVLDKLLQRLTHEAGALADRSRNQSSYSGAAAEAAAQVAVVAAQLATLRSTPSAGSAVEVDV